MPQCPVRRQSLPPGVIPNHVSEGYGPTGGDLLLPSLFFGGQNGACTSGPQKLRAHQPLSCCALFRLRREVFRLPDSIWRERRLPVCAWQVVSSLLLVEFCAPLCKS